MINILFAISVICHTNMEFTGHFKAREYVFSSVSIFTDSSAAIFIRDHDIKITNDSLRLGNEESVRIDSVGEYLIKNIDNYLIQSRFPDIFKYETGQCSEITIYTRGGYFVFLNVERKIYFIFGGLIILLDRIN